MNIMQTKPMRSYGIDVTQTTLQPVLDSLGIDEQVKNLSQAEKEILRYIATLKQASVSMGDFANNLESPSNQMKIFKQQLVEAKVALSSLFIGTFAKILPYANAFLMVIKEVSSAIATMFGIELTDYNTGIASQEGIYDGIADSADNATDSVKELKRQTLGFDEIHNINENKDSGSSGTSGVSGGIDQRLLDAITGYDNGMDKVKMKATEIRDRIMEWLGFTKEIDPLTGDVSFKLEGSRKNLKLIGGIVTTIASLKLVKGITGLVTGTSKLSKILGTSGLYKSIKNLVQYCKIYTSLANGDLLKGITGGTQAWFNQQSVLTQLGIVMIGSISSYTSFNDIYYKIGKNVGFTNEELANSVIQLGLTMTALGLFMGPAGIVIGGLSALVGATQGYCKALDDIRSEQLNEKFFDGIGISINDFCEQVKASQTTFENSIEKINEWGTTIDNNKKIIEDNIETIEYYSAKYEATGTLTEEETNKMISAFQSLRDSVKENFELATQGIFQTFKVSLSDVADKVGITVKDIAGDLFWFQSQFQEKSDALEEQIKALEEQMISGTPTNEQIEQWMSLQEQYTKLNPEVDLLTTKYQDLIREFSNGKIDFSSTETAKEKINELATTYDELKEKTETAKLEALNNVDQLIAKIPAIIDDPQKQEELKSAMEKWKDGIRDGFTLKEEELTETFNSAKNIIQGQLNEKMDELIESAKPTASDYTKSFFANLFSGETAGYKVDEGARERAKNSVVEQFEPIQSALNEFGSTIGNNLPNEIYAGITENQQIVPTALNSMLSKMDLNESQKETIKKQYYDYGSNTVGGLVEGIKNDSSIPADEMSKIVEEIEKSVVDYFDIHSPSRLMKAYGINIIEGLTLGIKNDSDNLLGEFKTVLNKLKEELNYNEFKIQISTNLESSFNSILNKLQTFINKFRNGINNLLGNMSSSMNSVYVGKDNKIYYNSMPYISVPKFANGGMPEDGLFFANHNELVGKFNNGNTAVANNLQIEKGIEEASYRGYMRAIADSGISGGQSSEIDVHVHTDEGTVIDRIEQRTKQTGVFPFTIPTY